MAVFKSSEQVFLYFRDKFGLDSDGEMNAVGLFAFAIVEKQKMDWLSHCRESQESEPTEHQISGWYQSKPQSYFDEVEKIAYIWFATFGTALLSDKIEEAKKTAIKEALGKLGSLWTSFWMGNLVGLTSNLVFTLLIVIFAMYVTSDFSIVAWTKKIIAH